MGGGGISLVTKVEVFNTFREERGQGPRLDINQ